MILAISEKILRTEAGMRKVRMRRSRRTTNLTQKSPSLMTCDTLFLRSMMRSRMKKKRKRARDMRMRIELSESEGTWEC